MNSDDVMRKLKHLANLETMVVTSPHLEAENGELVYITTCGCGEKLRLTSVQLERVTYENR